MHTGGRCSKVIIRLYVMDNIIHILEDLRESLADWQDNYDIFYSFYIIGVRSNMLYSLLN